MRTWPVSAWTLVAANLWELVGVLAFGWNPFHLAFVYWAENVVIGLYNVPRLLLSRAGRWAALEKSFLVVFFLVHFGGFCFIHGLALNALWQHFGGGGPGSLLGLLAGGRSWPLWAGLGLLVLSHGQSFVVHGILEGERLPVGDQMLAPYPRVFVMHAAVLAGALVLVFTGMPRLFGALLVVLKVALDLRAHLRERAKALTRAA